MDWLNNYFKSYLGYLQINTLTTSYKQDYHEIKLNSTCN